MANTYTQIYIQIIFATKGRQKLLDKNLREDCHKYIAGIIKNKKQRLFIINSMPDHVHTLIELKPDISLSDLVRDIKANSSSYINDKKIFATKFNWQKGFGAFSYSRSQLPKVINYIQNQEQHHKNKTFREEYIDFLKKFNVDYDERYIFQEED